MSALILEPHNPNFELPKPAHLMIQRPVLYQRVSEMGTALREFMHGHSRPIVGIALMNGALPFFSDLRREMDPRFYPFHLRTKRYDDSRAGGDVQVVGDEPSSDQLKGSTAVVIEDITDKGHTMAFVVPYLKDHGAEQVVVCSLLDKPSAREVDVDLHLVGFEVGDRWVFGYGMDDGLGNNWVRNLPEIYYYGDELSGKGYKVPSSRLSFA